MIKGSALTKLVVIALVLFSFALDGLAATVSSKRKARSDSQQKIAESSSAKKKMSRLKRSRRVTRAKGKRKRSRRSARRRHLERFYTPSYVDDVEEGDIVGGEDPTVRAAALEALGNFNGSVMVMDPSDGRILAMVNQKLALSQGAIPCSTIKVPVALAALREGLVTKDTRIMFTRRWGMDMTKAMAVSNNNYFEAVGRRLGFEKVSYYLRQYGLGELAGWNIEGEQPGLLPEQELAAKRGGVGKMCSFGESISLTPLQLGALMGAIANGGTLYYLQHPTSSEEVQNFTPMVKRHLDIASLIPEISYGLSDAVLRGTARTLRTSFYEEPVLGKTGTCSENGTRYGWFASYADTQYGRVVTVVFLRGGYAVYGPKAAEIAGKLYRSLYDRSYFAAKAPVTQSKAEGTAVGASE